ncbi:MAG TPA: helix-turn-helix domain-containing protein [Candidatus Cloacimonadota bacterium]|nr:helix-turn-helix domain-containing protein [Candidatus Cloacimonadota bacterium]HPM00997.1 helix-turn-helix domain-containing protein [Candidatus Cloacimonadota bacterium]
MNINTIIEMLKKNGFTEREAKVYSILLMNPNLTPPQIHSMVGMTRPRIYEILSTLISKGMITEDLAGNKKVYKVLDPKSTFHEMIKEKEKEFEQYKAENESLSEMVQEIYNQSALDQSPYYQLEHLSDPVSIGERINYYWGKAEREILIFFKQPQVSSSNNTIPDDVKIRTIFEYNGDLKTKTAIKDLIKNMGPKDELRVLEELPLKLLVIDNQICALGFSQNDPSPGKMNTLFFNEPIIAAFMKEIFEARWQKAIPWEQINLDD